MSARPNRSGNPIDYGVITLCKTINNKGDKQVNRTEFHDFFGDNAPIILPVIHVIDHQQTATNIDKLIDAGISGCFLINHDFDVETFLPIIARFVRSIQISG